MWQIFLMYALFGSIFSIGKIGLAASQPYFLTGTRMLVAGGLMLAYLVCFNRKGLTFSRHDWGLLLLVAFFNVFITNAFEFWGLQYMSAAKTCLIYSLSPFAAAFIAYLFGTEQMTRKKWMGLIVGFLAFCPMMLAPWFDTSAVEMDFWELWAEAALVVSAISCVLGWTFMKKLTIDRQRSPILINSLSFLLAGVMSLSTSLAIENWDPVPVFAWKEFIFALVYIVLIHNIICYSIYAAALQRYSVTFLSFAGLSNPIFAAFVGWIVLGEGISDLFWLALCGVIVGLYLFYQAEEADSRARLTQQALP